jgi:Flp pilus assembly protein CpaB
MPFWSVVVKRSNRLLMFLGVLFALVGGLLTLVVLNGSASNGGSSSAASAEVPQQVVVAKAEINLGDTITADMLELQDMTLAQRQAVGGDTYTRTEDVVGKVAGGKILAGQPIIVGNFINAGSMIDGQSIASAIGHDKVGVAIEVDQINGVGTLLVPGDRIDILLSPRLNGIKISYKNKTTGDVLLDLEGGTEPTTKIVIQNCRIVATEVQTVATTGPAGASAATGAAAPEIGFNGRHMILIVEVQPAEAEVIRWAQRAEGDDQTYLTMSVALRSDKDNDKPDVATTGVNFAQLVARYKLLPADPRGYVPVDIMQLVNGLAAW